MDPADINETNTVPVDQPALIQVYAGSGPTATPIAWARFPADEYVAAQLRYEFADRDPFEAIRDLKAEVRALREARDVNSTLLQQRTDKLQRARYGMTEALRADHDAVTLIGRIRGLLNLIQ